MIAIVNITPENKPFGENNYELRINSEVITTFNHNREDGLAVCLKKASIAAEQAKWDKFAKIIKEL